MIKVLKKAKLIDDLKGVGSPQVVLFRTADKLVRQNLETDGNVKFNAITGEVTISFSLRDGESVFLGDKKGFIPKKVL